MTVKFLTGDALAVLRTLPSGSVQACITSPPYMGLRDYGTGTWAGGDAACDHKAPANPQTAYATGRCSGDAWAPADKTLAGGQRQYSTTCGQCGAIRTDRQLGLEPTIDAYVSALVEVMREVRRVLHDSGTLLMNLGDTYWNGGGEKRDNGHGFVDGGKIKLNAAKGALLQAKCSADGLPPKSLLMIPSRVALALQADGWVLRSMMPWVKRSAMPESVTDRPASAVEYVFLLAKRNRYYWDAAAIMRCGPYGYSVKPGMFDRIGDGLRGPIRTTVGSGPDGNGGARNFRNSDLFYDSLAAPPYGLISDHAGEPLAMDVNPEAFPSAHFATYPTRLVDPLIRAATSERGCCAACGGPWVRVTEASYTDANRGMVGNQRKAITDDRVMHAGREDDKRLNKHVATTGWRQSCACPAAPPVPQTVLDPFSGAGTTAICAHRLGRDAIGVELNPDYVAMARARLEADAGMFADVESDVPAAALVAVDKWITGPRQDANGRRCGGPPSVPPPAVPDAAQCELFATLVAAQ